MSALKLLASRNYISVNKDLIREFGLVEAVILGELCSEYEYWEKEGKLKDGMFFCSVAKLEENTGLSEYQQRTAINNLKNAGVLKVTLKDIPATRYFYIDENKLFSYLSSSSEKIKELDTEKLNSSNNSNNKNKINKNTNTNVLVPIVKDKPKTKSKNLYDKCLDIINEFTDNETVRKLLQTYLRFRLEVKDKPLYSNQFKGMLNKLKELTDTIEDMEPIIQQSIDKGYLAFYPLHNSIKDRTIKQSTCESNVKSIRMSEEDKRKQEEFLARMKKEGKQIEF